MLPHSYELPAAILLILGGALSCFAGYRLFKIVLGIYGFVLGAMLASSAMGVTNTTGMIVASLVGGVCGALLLMFAYFVGIALVGAGLGALIAHVAWSTLGKGGDPPALVVVLLSVLGSIAAMILQRYVIIVATAFGGAWTVSACEPPLGGAAAPDVTKRTSRARFTPIRGGRHAGGGGVRQPPATCGSSTRPVPRQGRSGCRSRGSCSG